MKKLLFGLLMILLAGCKGATGPVGPDGPAGPPGQEGPAGPVGQGFEVEANFNAGNEYANFFNFSDYGAEALDTDIVLVYWRYDIDQNDDNVWQQLPASVFYDNGDQLQYSFDHTLNDVQLYLTGDVNLATVSADYTQNQVFRIAIVPVDYVQTHNIDVKNIRQVMHAIGKDNFEKVKLKRK